MAKSSEHRFAEAVDESVTGHLFCAYPELPPREKKAGGRSPFASLRRIVASGVETSCIDRVFSGLGRFMIACRLRVYGVFFLSLGFYSALAWLLAVLLSPSVTPDYTALYWAVATAIVSLPSVLSHKTLSEALRDSSFGSFFETALGVRRETMDTEATRGRSWVAFLLGLALGALTYFVPLPLILGVLAALVFVLRVFVQPEFGVPLLFFLMPLAPTIVLIFAIAVLLISLAIKVIRGNRTFRPETLDVAVLVFGVFFLFGGIFSVSAASLQPALVYVCFLGAFFLVVFSMTTEAWLRRCAGAALFGGFAVSLLGIAEAVTGRLAGPSAWLDQTVFGSIPGRAVATLENPNMLGEYLVLLLPLALYGALHAEGAKSRFFGVVSFVSMVACLGLTFSRGAWVAATAAFLFYMILDRRSFWPLVLTAAVLVPLVLWVLPGDFFLRLTTLSDSSVLYRVHIWEGTLLVLRDFFWGGIGVGYAAWQKIYPTYALEAIEQAPHAHSLPLTLLVEIGVFGLLVFAAVMFLFMQSQNRFRIETKRMASISDEPGTDTFASLRAASSALGAGIFGSMVFGLFDHAWYNYRVYLMFWLVLGLASATARTGRAAMARRRESDLPAENTTRSAAVDFTAVPSGDQERM